MGVAPTATWLMRPVGSFDLPAMVGTVGIAPTPSRLQRDVQTVYTTFPKNWHGRQVTLLHETVLETAALLVGHVRVSAFALLSFGEITSP